MARRRTSPIRNPFEVLGVDASADEATIKQAYRRLAAELHPDRNPSPDATERLKEVVAAWEILSDAEERQRYAARSAQESDVELTPRPPPKTAPSYKRSRRPQRPLRPTTREAFIFETMFSQLTGSAGDDDVDDSLGSFFTMLMTFVCVMSLAFYAFQSALPQEFPQPDFDIAAHALRPENPSERRAALPTKSDIVYDYADRGFWTWMLIGSACAFCPKSLAWLLLHLGRFASPRQLLRPRPSRAAEAAAVTSLQGLVRMAGWIIICVLPRALPQWLS